MNKDLNEGMIGGLDIRYLIETYRLISGFKDINIQLQAHGFDLTVDTIEEIMSSSLIDFDNSLRTLPKMMKCGRWAMENETTGEGSAFYLDPHRSYIVTFAETVNMNIPGRCISALAQARSSLIRMGAILGTAVWDNGYKGRGQALIQVGSWPVIVYPHARVAQIVFFWTSAGPKYAGIYNEVDV